MTDVIKLLQSGNSVDIQPRGTSMYPLILDKRGDRFTIVPIDQNAKDYPYKRGDILLYRSKLFNGLTVHRLIKIKADGLYICGDNQQTIEGPVSKTNVYGIVTEITRKGKTFSVKRFSYRVYVFIWINTIGIRRIFRPTVTKIHMMFKKKDK